MSDPFTFGSVVLAARMPRAYRAFAAKHRKDARFYFTYDGQLRAKLNGDTYVWRLEGKDNRNRKVYSWQLKA